MKTKNKDRFCKCGINELFGVNFACDKCLKRANKKIKKRP